MACCEPLTIEEASFEYDDFVLECPRIQGFTVATGENIAARSVVSLDGSGELVFDNTNIIGILVNAVDATTASLPGQVYRAGKFDEDKLVLSAGTVDTVREELSKIGILLEKVLS